jgi:hypothetical protein
LRARIDAHWQQRVKSIVENYSDWSAKRIENLLKHEAERLERRDWPRERTIRRMRQRHLDSPDDVRSKYRFFRWPDSMERGELPWEAAPFAFEVIRTGDSEVLMSHMKWLWRVELAIGDAPFPLRRQFAMLLAAREAGADVEVTPDIHEQMVKAAWRSSEVTANSFEAAITPETLMMIGIDQTSIEQHTKEEHSAGPE